MLRSPDHRRNYSGQHPSRLGGGFTPLHQQRFNGPTMDRAAARRRGGGPGTESLLTRAVNAVFAFVRLAEFEILFLLFFLIAFLIFKDLTSRPDYNQILVKKPHDDFLP